ncbi:hypothetical protein C8F04DRAFT_947099 [Mycena alexandri]|uniref:Uncharacterized protein n=1 Tax=Mycena alexandri TaxID=1745969 RepID=A0AAD6T882_9AGAR|nr:hypothetical protein C8F04DRAFT_947099 [Mycena alexandri]
MGKVSLVIRTRDLSTPVVGERGRCVFSSSLFFSAPPRLASLPFIPRPILFTPPPSTLFTSPNLPIFPSPFAHHPLTSPPFTAHPPTSAEHPALNRFLLPSQEYVLCVLWDGLYCITATDIIRMLVFRFVVRELLYFLIFPRTSC